MIYKACSRCGKIHPKDFTCRKGVKDYHTDDAETKFRRSKSWTDKSRDIRDKAHYMCEVCKAEGRITTESLEVHHIEKLKDAPQLSLDDYNLICLCYTHHRLADRGQISKAKLKEIASAREKESPVVF